jgi:hypothetical protein
MKVLDDNGNFIPELSLVHTLKQCNNFLNEMSMLDYVCEQLKTNALITIKYQFEVIDKGMEYSLRFLEIHL